MQYFVLPNQAFSPNEPVKPGEVLSRQNISLNIGGTSTSLPTTYQELVQRYQVGWAMIWGPVLHFLACIFHWTDRACWELVVVVIFYWPCFLLHRNSRVLWRKILLITRFIHPEKGGNLDTWVVRMMKTTTMMKSGQVGFAGKVIVAGRVTTVEEVDYDNSCKYVTGRLTCTFK